MVTGAPRSRTARASSRSAATLDRLYGLGSTRIGAVSSAVPRTSLPCTVIELTCTKRRTGAVGATHKSVAGPHTVTARLCARAPQCGGLRAEGKSGATPHTEIHRDP